MESDGDRLLTTFAPDRSVAIEWTAIGTGAFFVSLFGLGWLYGRAVAASTTAVGFSSFGVGAIATGVVGTILLLAGVVIVHELLHGAVIRYYGGDVSFGVGIASFVMPYAYATTTLWLRATAPARARGAGPPLRARRRLAGGRPAGDSLERLRVRGNARRGASRPRSARSASSRRACWWVPVRAGRRAVAARHRR